MWATYRSPRRWSPSSTEWWTSYQPVSYKLDSKLGTEAEFKTMIATCNAAGVEIIADSVINHTTGADQGEGTGVAGSKYDGEGNFPAIPYAKENFHDCTKNIGDYTNADEVQNCRLTSLQDLDTSQEYVQDKLADYMNRLLDLGVYGFRVDAVKHIATADVAAIKAKLAEKSGRNADDIFFEQEVIGNAPKPRKSSRATMWRTARSPNSTSPTTCRSPSPATSPTPARALRRSAATAG